MADDAIDSNIRDAILRTILECPVCQELFDEQTRTPRVLPCQHTFCSTCLAKLVHGDVITCPQCRAEHTVTGQAVVDLPKDNTRRYLLELVKMPVTICVECEEYPATSRCVTCTNVTYMCDVCAAAHKRQKKTKSHKVHIMDNGHELNTSNNGNTSDNTTRDIAIPCKIHSHTGNYVVSYCMGCNILVCNKCITERHTDHVVKDLPDAHNTCKAKLDELVAAALAQNPKETLDNCDLLLKNTKGKCKELKEQINTQFDLYLKVVSNRHVEINKTIDEFSDARVKILEAIKVEHESKVEAFELAKQQAKDLKAEDDGVSFLNAFKPVSESLVGCKGSPQAIPTTLLRYTQACTTDDFGNIVAAMGTVGEHTPDQPGEPERDGRVISDATTESSLHLQCISFQDMLRSLLDTQIPAVGTPTIANHNDVALPVLAVVKDAGEQTVDEQSVTIPKRLSVHIAHVTVDNLTKAKADAYGSSRTRAIVQVKLDRLNLSSYWEVNGRSLTMHSTTELMAQRSMQILKDAVYTKRLAYRKESSNVLESDKWQQLRGEESRRHPEKVWMSVLPESREIMVCSTCQQALHEVCDAVQICMSDNIVHMVIMKYTVYVTEQIMKQRSKIQAIKNSNSQFGVDITKEDNWIKVQGIGIGLAMAVRAIHQIATASEDRFNDNSDGDEDGDNKDEARFSDMDDEDSGSDNDTDVALTLKLLTGENDVTVKAVCYPGDDSVIYVVTGDITQLPVETVVCPADPKLHHDGGLAKALTRKGGWSIQQECVHHVKTEGQVTPGHIFYAAPGTMLLRAIVFAVGTKWNERSEPDKVLATSKLAESVTRSLEAAMVNSLTTVAIPAIGAGAYRVPLKVSASTIVGTVKDFLTANPRSGIREIYLCDQTVGTTDQFVAALTNHFKPNELVVGQESIAADQSGPVLGRSSSQGGGQILRM